MPATRNLINDRYMLETLIAEGSMGAVYQATDQQTGDIVALKYQSFIDTPIDETVEREAKQLCTIAHPLLPQMHDYFRTEQGQFLVMEFVAGESLYTSMLHTSKPFPLVQVLQWADQLLDCLDYLHRQQPPIIHRDIKPQNLKLGQDGQIKLLDVGLAKGMRGLAELEGINFAFYAPDYAPPELIQGKGADPRSDLYALAATLHHLFSGAVPADAILRADDLAENRPDPQRPVHVINRFIPEAVSDILWQALALSPDERPDSAAVMRQALRGASQDIPVLVYTTPIAAPAPQKKRAEADESSVRTGSAMQAEESREEISPMPKSATLPTALLWTIIGFLVVALLVIVWLVA
jgi:serine/threonine protein kinase